MINKGGAGSELDWYSSHKTPDQDVVYARRLCCLVETQFPSRDLSAEKARHVTKQTPYVRYQNSFMWVRTCLIHYAEKKYPQPVPVLLPTAA
jgi:hypothetical protein